MTTVGEVDSGRRPWRNGSLPVTFPPAQAIGSADCLAAGLNSTPVPVQTIAGFPMTCWQTPPDPTPIVWYRPDELSKLVTGQVVVVHPDASQYGNDATTLVPNTWPTFINPGGVPGAVFIDAGQALFGLQGVKLSGDFAIYLVIASAGFVFPPFWTILLEDLVTQVCPIGVTNTQLLYASPLTPHSFALVGSELLAGALFAIRRTGTTITARVNLHILGTAQDPAVYPFNSSWTYPYFLGFVGSSQAYFRELRIYAATVTDALDASIAGELVARYNLGP